MTDERYKNECTTVQSPLLGRSHARGVTVRGETPNESYNGEVVVFSISDGKVSLSVSRSSVKKFGGKRWHTERVFLTLTQEAWEHLRNAPMMEQSVVSE